MSFWRKEPEKVMDSKEFIKLKAEIEVVKLQVDSIERQFEGIKISFKEIRSRLTSHINRDEEEEAEEDEEEDEMIGKKSIKSPEPFRITPFG
jgi:chaperonin cofactor prefoldin